MAALPAVAASIPWTGRQRPPGVHGVASDYLECRVCGFDACTQQQLSVQTKVTHFSPREAPEMTP